MINQVRHLLLANPFVPFTLRAYGEDYLIPGPYHAKYDAHSGYLIIFLNDDDHTLIYGQDIRAVIENSLGE